MTAAPWLDAPDPTSVLQHFTAGSFGLTHTAVGPVFGFRDKARAAMFKLQWG